MSLLDFASLDTNPPHSKFFEVPDGDRIKLPEKVRRDFHNFKNRYPNAVIAGGYLRDLFLGRMPKDIDIWLPDGDYSGYTGRKQVSDAEYQRAVMGVYSEGPFEIIEIDMEGGSGIDFWKHVIQRFDMALCQIAYDGKVFGCTDKFLTDVREKRITYLRSWNEENKQSRIKRIMDKYPDFTFLDQTEIAHDVFEGQE